LGNQNVFKDKLFGYVPVSKKFNTVHYAFDKTGFPKDSLGNLSTIIKPIKVFNIENCVMGFEHIVFKPAFGQTSVNGHLSTFKTGTNRPTGPCLESLMSPGRGFTHTGTGTTPYSFSIFSAAGSRSQIM
jgi:hypothetical protein